MPDIQVGDAVLVKQRTTHKAMPPYDSRPWEVTQRTGTMVTAETPGKKTTRDISFFRKVPRRSTVVDLSGEDGTLTEPEATTVEEETSMDQGVEDSVEVTSEEGEEKVVESVPRRSGRDRVAPRKYEDFVR